MRCLLVGIAFLGLGWGLVYGAGYECKWRDEGSEPTVNFTSCTTYVGGNVSCIACDSHENCGGCCWLSTLNFFVSGGASVRIYEYEDGVQVGAAGIPCPGQQQCLITYFASGEVDPT